MAAFTTAAIVVAGTAASVYSSKKQSDAQKKAAQANATSAELDTAQAIAQARRDSFKARGAAQAGWASAGLDTSFGSILDVVRESATNEARTVDYLSRGGTAAVEAYRSQARAAGVAGTVGMVSGALGGLTTAYNAGMFNKGYFN